jgi:flagellar basal-body rod protein FlgF
LLIYKENFLARPLQLLTGYGDPLFMDNTLYVGLSRQITLQRALDITANNIANSDTAGFKVESLMLRNDPETPASAPATEPINYVLDNGVARNYGQGSLEQTGNPLDVAIEGPGFFTVQTANGLRYTRDGRFTVDATGKITDKQGDTVLDSSGSPITVDPQNGQIAIAKDGTISQSTPTGQTAQVGKMGVVRFTDLTALTKEGDNLYQAAGGQTPTAAPDAQIHQAMVEKSNVQSVAEITHLIAITRAYERVTQMMSQTQDLSESAVQRLGKAA